MHFSAAGRGLCVAFQDFLVHHHVLIFYFSSFILSPFYFLLYTTTVADAEWNRGAVIVVPFRVKGWWWAHVFCYFYIDMHDGLASLTSCVVSSIINGDNFFSFFFFSPIAAAAAVALERLLARPHPLWVAPFVAGNRIHTGWRAEKVGYLASWRWTFPVTWTSRNTSKNCPICLEGAVVNATEQLLSNWWAVANVLLDGRCHNTYNYSEQDRKRII